MVWLLQPRHPWGAPRPCGYAVPSKEHHSRLNNKGGEGDALCSGQGTYVEHRGLVENCSCHCIPCSCVLNTWGACWPDAVTRAPATPPPADPSRCQSGKPDMDSDSKGCSAEAERGWLDRDADAAGGFLRAATDTV